MATILVGPEHKNFMVHQTLLCDRSKYFAKALTGSFEESKTGTVKLEDVSPVLFKIVVSWFYCGKIVYTASEDGSNIDQDFAGFGDGDENKMNEDDISTWPKQVLVELYVLADRLDIKRLRDNTIDALITAISESSLSLRVRSYAFVDSNTTAESSLRKFAVDCLAYHLRHSMVDHGFWLDLPHDIAITALLLSAQRAPRALCNSCHLRGLIRNAVKLADDHPCKYEDKMSIMMDNCLYHEHADDEEKKACQASRNQTAKK